MPGPGLGVSFVPGQVQGGQPQGQAPPGQALQQAIQFITTRLPRVVGAHGLAPQGLMNGPGGAAMGGNGDLERLLAMLFGPGGHLAGGTQGAPMGGGMPPAGMPGPSQAPGPHFTPGDVPPQPPPGNDTPQLPTFSPSPPAMVDRTMPGGNAGTYQPGPWSVGPLSASKKPY